MSDSMFKQAEETELFIPSLAIVLEEGDKIGGFVAVKGEYIHEQWGTSPTVMFDRDGFETSITKARLTKMWKANPELDPAEAPFSLIGIGTVLSKIGHVNTGQYLFVERLADVDTDKGNPYRNYKVLMSDPTDPKTLVALPRAEWVPFAERQGQLFGAGVGEGSTVPARPATPDEEPF
mgnify:CR=1 FL=1